MKYTCRIVIEPTFSQALVARVKEDYPFKCRNINLMDSSKVFTDLDEPSMSAETDQKMIKRSIAKMHKTKVAVEGFVYLKSSKCGPKQIFLNAPLLIKEN